MAFSSSVRSGTTLRMSSRPLNAKRIEPSVKRLLPPRSSSGARSSTMTDAPAARADSAAHNAALPAPTTSTSHVRSAILRGEMAEFDVVVAADLRDQIDFPRQVVFHRLLAVFRAVVRAHPHVVDRIGQMRQPLFQGEIFALPGCGTAGQYFCRCPDDLRDFRCGELRNDAVGGS